MTEPSPPLYRQTVGARLLDPLAEQGPTGTRRLPAVGETAGRRAPLLAAASPWRVARSLDVLLAQFNNARPARSKASDGAIGNAAHLAEGWNNSDHNPWYPAPGGGIVTARDFTHDPAHGMDIAVIADQLVASRDPRIKYVIANRRICDSRPNFNPWRWMPYNGPSPHLEHVHLSVMDNPSCDDTTPWRLPMFGTQPPTQPPAKDDVMALTQDEHNWLALLVAQLVQGVGAPGDPNRWGWPTFPGGSGEVLTVVDYLRRSNERQEQILARLDALAQRDAVGGLSDADVDRIVDRLAQRLAGKAAA